MRKVSQLWIVGLAAALISIALSVSYMYLPLDFGCPPLFSNLRQLFLVTSVILLIVGALFFGFGHVEDKHEAWLDRCACVLAPYEETLLGATETRTAKKACRRTQHSKKS